MYCPCGNRRGKEIWASNIVAGVGGSVCGLRVGAPIWNLGLLNRVTTRYSVRSTKLDCYLKCCYETFLRNKGIACISCTYMFWHRFKSKLCKVMNFFLKKNQ